MPPVTLAKRDLSQGAILGIVFGVLGAICIIGLIYGFFFRPNKQEGQKKEEQKIKDAQQEALHAAGAPVGPATASHIQTVANEMALDNVKVSTIAENMPLDKVGVNSIAANMALDNVGINSISANMALDKVNMKSITENMYLDKL